jgi:thioesterase domain-containing protein
MPTPNAQPLRDFYHRYVPISQQMGIDVIDYDGTLLRCGAPLTPNINDKLTAFGGSLYTLSVVTGWGMVFLKSLEHGLREPNVVVIKGEIDYLMPVAGDFVASCVAPADDVFAQFFDRFAARGRARIACETRIEYGGNTAVVFKGTYGLIGAQ